MHCTECTFILNDVENLLIECSPRENRTLKPTQTGIIPKFIIKLATNSAYRDSDMIDIPVQFD